MLKIIAIGKKHEPWVAAGIERYQKRLQRPWNIAWELLPHSPFDSNNARHDESERILSRCGADEFVVVLDERGNCLTPLPCRGLLAKHSQATAHLPLLSAAHMVLLMHYVLVLI